MNPHSPEALRSLKVLAIVLFVFAAFSAIFGYVHYRKATGLIDRGKPAQAQVESMTRRSKAGVVTGYYVKVSFLSDGKPAQSELLVSDELGERLWASEKSELINIIYLPDDPTFTAMADQSDRAMGHSDDVDKYTGFLLAGPTALLGSALLFLYRRRARLPQAQTAN